MTRSEEKRTMEMPLQITSHDFVVTPGIEAEIRERADRLDAYTTALYAAG